MTAPINTIVFDAEFIKEYLGDLVVPFTDEWLSVGDHAKDYFSTFMELYGKDLFGENYENKTIMMIAIDPSAKDLGWKGTTGLFNEYYLKPITQSPMPSTDTTK